MLLLMRSVMSFNILLCTISLVAFGFFAVWQCLYICHANQNQIEHIFSENFILQPYKLFNGFMVPTLSDYSF